ncbi:hypothetical protein CPLU01_08160 [Colletotrichum plurivorum]|uniref:Uncharacterized protein n=1 Tax=Colletotrichum plurivorum TaxID=2175906 RepID=A0A8H6KDJ3_9PEZI|nr:hypothetical protein CPLU01_08160 [Colletotrichum plurivorum]
MPLHYLCTCLGGYATACRSLFEGIGLRGLSKSKSPSDAFPSLDLSKKQPPKEGGLGGEHATVKGVFERPTAPGIRGFRSCGQVTRGKDPDLGDLKGMKWLAAFKGRWMELVIAGRFFRPRRTAPALQAPSIASRSP